MKEKLSLIVFLLITFCGCDLDNEIVKEETNGVQIPQWVKEQLSPEELDILTSLSKTHKLYFAREKENERGRYITLLEFINQELPNEHSFFVRLKSSHEGGNWGDGDGDGSGDGSGDGGGDNPDETEKLGIASSILCNNLIVEKPVKWGATLTIYFGYSYTTGKIKEITSADIDLKISGPTADQYYSGRGCSYEIVEGNKIHYYVEGDIRYKMHIGEDVVVEAVATSICEDKTITVNVE